jgi:hypothetical protein
LIVNKANSSPIESLNFSSKVLKWMLVLTLTEKKKNKLINKPRMFFNDSKNPFIKKIGRHYLKGLEKSQNI